MPMKKKFTTVLKGAEGIDTAAIIFPFDVKEVFGKARVPIKGKINKVPFRSTIVRMYGEYMVVVNKSMRDATKKKAGDKVLVEVEEDTQRRTVSVPPDLVAALKSAKLVEAFNSLSYTYRKEHVRSIEEAKRPETRKSRLGKIIAVVNQKKMV